MNISHFAEKHGVSMDTLRFYEELKLLIPDRKHNGYREYTALHHSQIQMIIALKSIGFSLKEIKILLDLSQKSASESCNMLSNQIIEKKIHIITQQLELLNYAQTTLFEVQAYIQNNLFIQNQQRIDQMIEHLYKTVRKMDK